MPSQSSAVDTIATVYRANPTRPSLLFSSPSRIPANDAIDLRWYFKNPPLVGVPECGFSGQLERLAVFSFGDRPCAKCGGSSRGEGRNGTGFTPIGALGKLSYGAAYRTFLRQEAARQGRAIVSQKSVELMDLLDGSVDEWGAPFQVSEKFTTWERMRELFPSIPEEFCRQCPSCKGDGTVERKTRSRTPITVRPTGSSVDGSGTAPGVNIDLEGVIRYGRISRLLEAVARVSLHSRVRIEVYFSEGGGSVDALWEFTDEGRALLGRLPNPRSLPPQELLENEREQQRAQPEDWRRLALARVESEANSAWSDDCRVWNGATKVERS